MKLTEDTGISKARVAEALVPVYSTVDNGTSAGKCFQVTAQAPVPAGTCSLATCTISCVCNFQGLKVVVTPGALPVSLPHSRVTGKR